MGKQRKNRLFLLNYFIVNPTYKLGAINCAGAGKLRAGPVVNSTFPENTTISQAFRISATSAFRCKLQTDLVTYGTDAALLAQFRR